MKRVNLSARSLSALMVIAAVMTTAPRHIIAALQMESQVITGGVWNVVIVLLSIAFAALEGAALLMIERAQTIAQAQERRRLSVIKWLIYLSIGAAFVLPVYAQSQHTTINALLAGLPVVLLVQSALIVAAPMFVISGAAVSGSVLSEREPIAPQEIAQAPEPVAIVKPQAPAMPQAPEALAIAEPQAEPVTVAQAPEPIAETASNASAGKIDSARLRQLLADNPNATSKELAREFGVSDSRIKQMPEWKARKEVTQND